MLKVKFYDTVNDELLRFAVVISSGYFASIKKEIHMKYREDIEKPVRIFLKLLKENCRKKQVQSDLR